MQLDASPGGAGPPRSPASRAMTTMNVSNVQMWRDGGTITFTVESGASEGNYRLQTPRLGEPRPLFRDERRLRLGGPEERALLADLRAWWARASPAEAEACRRLDTLEWRNLPPDLTAAVPLHRMRAVMACLADRTE